MDLGILRSCFQAFAFPSQCSLCGNWVVRPDFAPLCGSCFSSLPSLSLPLCDICGIPLHCNLLDPLAACTACRAGRWAFNRARAFGKYGHELARLIRTYKFGGRRRLAAPLATLLAHTFETHFSDLNVDYIVPVPLHSKKRKRRGFDQTLLLARRLSKLMGWTVFEGLVRNRHTRPQVGLSISERNKNLKGAFTLESQHELVDCRLLLIDDVMTTGTTVHEVSRSIRSVVRIEAIYVLTIARAVVGTDL